MLIAILLVLAALAFLHRHRLGTATVVALLVLFGPAAALAASSGTAPIAGDTETWLQRLIAVTVIAVGERLWQWLSGKAAVAKVQKHIDIHALIQMIAGEAIDYAEEQAHKLQKAGRGALNGAEKKSAALRFGLDLARKYGIDKLAQAELERIVEARLNARRGGGATSALAIAR